MIILDYQEKLLKANVMIPVMLRLEDFGLTLSRRAVSHVVDFVYRGEVVVPGERVKDVCAAAHALGNTRCYLFILLEQAEQKLGG